MSTPSFYLLRTKILVSFKSPVDPTLNLSRNQPLHQFLSGPRYILSGLDCSKRPGIDIPASAQPLTLPQTKSILHPATRVTLLKGKSDYIPSLFRSVSPLLTQSGSPSPYTIWFPIPTYRSPSFLRLLLCSLHHSQISLSAVLKCTQSTPASKLFASAFLSAWTLFPQRGAWITLSLPFDLGLKCHLP